MAEPAGATAPTSAFQPPDNVHDRMYIFEPAETTSRELRHSLPFDGKEELEVALGEIVYNCVELLISLCAPYYLARSRI